MSPSVHFKDYIGKLVKQGAEKQCANCQKRAIGGHLVGIICFVLVLTIKLGSFSYKRIGTVIWRFVEV